MKKIKTSFIAVAILLSGNAIIAQSDSAMIKTIYNEALSNGKSYTNLDYLSNKIGGRLSGSPQAQQAVEWAYKAMKEAGADTVYLQQCMVPHWIRGAKEIGKVTCSNPAESKEVPIAALGSSIGTPALGISANVIEAIGLNDLEKLGKDKIKGKIVFFNEPMDPTFIETFNAYGKAVKQRWGGAMAAAKYGAVAVVVRSCTLTQDDFPHTGVMGYTDTVKKIPACCISTNGANWLSNQLKKDKDLKFFLKMNCDTLPDEKSFNVVGEIRGSLNPKEYIVVGGHLDSWDTGKGSNDDGSGVVQSIEVIRIFKALGIKPKRTIRAVAFMNEENGGRGGKKYAELAKKNNEKHIAAIESDAGGFTPRGFSSDVTPEVKAKLKSWRPLFEPYGVYNFDRDGSGSDINPLKAQGVPCMELMPDSQRYFAYHHTPDDVFANVNQRELELGDASMAALIWMISKYGL